jgi:hypothetical protein
MTKEEKKALFEEFCQFIDSKEVVNDTVDVQRTITVDTDEYEVGDVITFSLTTGEVVSAMAMRQEEDGMLFVFVDCLKDEQPMNEEDNNMGGYEASDLRKKLNEEILPTFPASIRNRMKPVYKEDKLRLLTAMEVFGENEYGNEDNDVYLPLMKKIRNRIAFQGHATDKWEWYWLQNTYGASTFATVHYGGHANYYYASNSYGVRPAFKI